MVVDNPFIYVLAFANATDCCVIFISLDPCPSGSCVENGDDLACM